MRLKQITTRRLIQAGAWKTAIKKPNEISTDNIDTVRDGGVIPEGVCGNQSAANHTAAFLITEKTVSAANPFQRYGN